MFNYLLFVNPYTKEVFKSKNTNEPITADRWNTKYGAQTLLKDYVDDNFDSVWIIYKKQENQLFPLMTFVNEDNARKYHKHLKDHFLDVLLDFAKCKLV